MSAEHDTTPCDDLPMDEALLSFFPAAERAVKTGDAELLERLLHEQPSLAAARSRQGRTLLHHLCDAPGHRDMSLGRLLIGAGADVNARAIDPVSGETALQWAASNDDAAAVTFLIEAGSSVDGLADDRRPLAQALWYGCPQVIATLLRKGASLDLELAAGVGRLELLPSFFDEAGHLRSHAGCHHAPVGPPWKGLPSQTELLAQSLIYAVIGGSVRAAAYLLDRGADVHAQPPGFGHTRATALHWAAGGIAFRASLPHRVLGEGDEAMVELLVARGASLRAVDLTYGGTPLGWAQTMNRPAMVRQLEKLESVL